MPLKNRDHKQAGGNTLVTDMGVVDDDMTQIDRYPILTTEQEQELGRRKNSGDQVAFRKLIESNLLLVLNGAEDYKNKKGLWIDLIYAGHTGLMIAVARFDPVKVFCFEAYAKYWINHFQAKEINDRKRGVIPFKVDFTDIMNRYTRALIFLHDRLKREPTVEEIATEMKEDLDKVKLLKNMDDEMEKIDLEAIAFANLKNRVS